VGRGSAIVENDLIKALDQGWVAAAVLDVFVHEPLQADSPLWTQPNAWITPHNSGTSFVEDIVPIFCENYRRFTQGRELNHVVDFSKGY
jgi:phosphoglycerate dehydrogenase-like enzyme